MSCLGLARLNFSGLFEADVYELRLLAHQVLSIPVPGSPELCTGLPFRYQPSV